VSRWGVRSIAPCGALGGPGLPVRDDARDEPLGPCAATLVLTLLFTTGVLRSGDRGGVAARAIGVAAFLGCAGVVLLGRYVMFATK
jgi:hypothetical protein